MKNKINIAELLKDCPSGMELDCTLFDDVHFDSVDEVCDIIKCYIKDSHHKIGISFNKYGHYSNIRKAKCVIFPKGKTTWEGFVPPCKFKDGDVCYIKTKTLYEYIFILKVSEDDDCIPNYVTLSTYDLYTDISSVCATDSIKEIRLATEEEKQKLFKAIKDNGYRWNTETKTLEKLIEPKFKVGDRIQSKNFIEERTIKICEEDGYWTTVDSWIRISDQDNWELVPNKFDITTLKPFESRVLVRNHNHHYWRISFFGFFDKNKCVYDTIRGIYSQCIPYEGNEHLCGTTNDCDNFYKSWE